MAFSKAVVTALVIVGIVAGKLKIFTFNNCCRFLNIFYYDSKVSVVKRKVPSNMRVAGIC